MSSRFAILFEGSHLISLQTLFCSRGNGMYKIVIVGATLVLGSVVVYLPAYERYALRQVQTRDISELVEASRILEERLHTVTKERDGITDGMARESVSRAEEPITPERFLHMLGVEALQSGIEISDVSQRVLQTPQRRVLYEVMARGAYAKLATFSDALLQSGYAISLHTMLLSAEGISSEVFTLKARLVFEIV